jgi:hypothetical protein
MQRVAGSPFGLAGADVGSQGVENGGHGVRRGGNRRRDQAGGVQLPLMAKSDVLKWMPEKIGGQSWATQLRERITSNDINSTNRPLHDYKTPSAILEDLHNYVPDLGVSGMPF